MMLTALMLSGKKWLILLYLTFIFHLTKTEGTFEAINQINIASLDLGLKLLNGKPGDNQLTTPYTINVLITAVHESANGETADEIRDHVLKFKDHASFIEAHKSFTHLSDDLELGTALYAGTHVESKFVNHMAEYFKTKVEAVDFRDQVSAAKTINDHFIGISKGKSGELIKPGALLNCRAVITSVIYFDFFWKKKFEEITYDWGKIKFQVSSTETIPIVRLKIINREFTYYPAKDGIEAYGVPFKIEKGRQKDLSYQFIIFKPTAAPKDPIKNLADMKEKLTGLKVMNIIKGMRSVTEFPEFQHYDMEEGDVTSFALSMPPFNINIPSKSVLDIFKDLGVKAAFEPSKARFNNMFGADISGIWISNIFTNAFLEVDKEGARGGGSGAVVYTGRGGGGPKQKVVDVPYMFFLGPITKPDGKQYTFNPLMMGTIYNPTLNEPPPPPYTVIEMDETLPPYPGDEGTPPAYASDASRPGTTPVAATGNSKWINIVKTAVAFVIGITIGKVFPRLAG